MITYFSVRSLLKPGSGKSFDYRHGRILEKATLHGNSKPLGGIQRKASLSFLLLIMLVSSALVSTSGPLYLVNEAQAQSLDPSCVSHDLSRAILKLLCGTATLTDIDKVVNDSTILNQESDKVWLLDADLVIENGASLSITSYDTDWLKMENPHGLVAYGNVVIDSVKVTSWDSKKNNYASTDGEQPRSYITMWEGGTGKMDILNSEIAYLGYHESHKQGFAYYSGHGSVVLNNDIHDMWYGFYSNAVGHMRIENNHIHDNAVYGLDPHTGTHSMIIRNNVVHNITKGIGIICSHDCYNILMENNVVYDVTVVGLMLSRNSTNSTIRNNLVYNSGTNGGGISVDDSSRNSVYNNTVSVGRFGIKISRNSDDNRVYNNTISSYSSYGICMIDGSSKNLVYDNIISNVGEYGICTLRGGSDNEVSSNAIIGTGYYGIYVRDENAANNVFKFNTVSDSGQNGVRVFNNTASTFVSNSVTKSTKSEYSAADARLILYNTTFASTYFDGSGDNVSSQVSIMNADSRVILADRSLSNVINEEGTVSIEFKLMSGEKAVLTTMPFAVKPSNSEIDISILEGRLGSNSAQMTWTEKTAEPAQTITVHHLLEGLEPGLSVEVTASEFVAITKEVVGQDGILEFSTEQKNNDATYSLTSSGIGNLGNASGIIELFDNPNDPSSLKTYGCEIYSSVVHCDPLVSNFTSYAVEGKFKVVQPLSTSSAAFVDGKYSNALKLSARYRESVEIMNTPAINHNEFSFSLWLRNSDEAEPYGHILSHVNFAGTAGWLVDMISTTGSQPYAQRLQFSTTNTQGLLIAPAEVEIPQDRFVHVAGVFDGSSVRFYVDGKLFSETPFRGQFNSDPGTPMRIGSASYSTSTHRWSGIVDDLWYFNRALSADEISAIAFQSDSAEFVRNDTDSSGLVARWAFEGNVEDSTGHGNDGAQTTLLASMAFAPDGRLFFSEKNTGNIRIMNDDIVLEEPFANLPDVYVSWEQGLLGLTLDRHFEDNHYVYQYYTYMDASTGEVFNKIVRFKDVDGKGTEMKILLDKIPAVKGYHSGGAVAFGPDDKLYVTVGDATEHPFAQDPNTLIGKVLRMNKDGTIPSDNPNPNSLVYTKGHRNAFGLAFDDKGIGIITENGEAAYDEINVISKGGNYGFPTLQPANLPPELADPTTSILPTRSYYETIAPTQAIYYRGDKIPELKGRFLFGTFTGDIYAIKIDPDSKKVTAEERLEIFPELFTPVIGIAQAPNGDIYYGSYAIFKLESLDLPTRIVDSYPIRIVSSEDMAVNDLVFDQDHKRVTLSVSTRPTASSSQTLPEASASIHSVSVQIPRALMDEISTVMVEDNNRELEFAVTSRGGASSPGGYNIVTFALDGMEQDSEVSIIAARVIPEFPLGHVWIMLSLLGFVTAAMMTLRKLRLGYSSRV